MQNLKYRTIIALGDSITNGCYDERAIGWFGRLSEKIVKHYPAKAGFNNLAMDGDRTMDVYHRLCAEALSRQPDILFIACGVNDLIRWQSEDSQPDFSPTLRREMWFNLLKTATENVPLVYVLSILPVSENRFPQPGAYDEPLWYKNADIQAYNEQIRSWCVDFGVRYLDTHALFAGKDLDQYLLDGVHPLADGHEAIATFVYNETITEIEKTAYANSQDVAWDIPAGDGAHRIYGLANYTKGGAGLSENAVFFVHGLTSHKNEYLHKIAASRFAAMGYDAYRFDLYGFEEDARRLKDCTLKNHAADLQAVLAAYADKYKNVFLIGHSYGAPAIMLAQPENIRAVSLWDPSFDLEKVIADQKAEKVADDLYMISWNIQFLIGRAMVEEARHYDADSCLKLSEGMSRVPIQVVHPAEGLYIDNEQSWHSAGHPDNMRVVIEGAGHTFVENSAADELFRQTEAFFRTYKI